MFEVEEAQHAQLARCVLRPVGLLVKNGDHVHVMNHNLHSKKDNDETDQVEARSVGGDAVRPVATLRYVIVECYDGSGQVEWRIGNICEIVAE